MSDSSSSGDDVPFGERIASLQSPSSKDADPSGAPSNGGDKGTANNGRGVKRVLLEEDSDSEDDLPLAERLSKISQTPPRKASGGDASAAPPKKKARAIPKPKQTVTLSGRVVSKAKTKPTSAAVSVTKKKAKASKSLPNSKGKKKRASGEGGKRGGKRNESKGSSTERKRMWEKLYHHGVLFPPPYKPHGIRMLYDGEEIDLTPEQEEVMTAYALMRETEYVNKPTFLKNAWAAMRNVLGPKHTIKKLDLCDFTPIWEWHLEEKEKKKAAQKAMTPQQRKDAKAEKEAAEAQYKFCEVDGRREQVGNFRVEPPGLFRGRGEHPKMGMWKRRIVPEDIIINIGEDAEVPPCPVPGHAWGRVQHDHSVTWLASWNDPVNVRDLKYVFLAANSRFKAESDLAKYEKARALKDVIANVRKDYTKGLKSKDIVKRQMACATYLIDRLALRAGHEKDEDEADTVGCCTLKVSNVEMLDVEEDGKHKVRFDFLGKDSIRYENVAEIEEDVYDNMKAFIARDVLKKPKKPESLIFDGMSANDLNGLFKNYMPGLSAKVFRTYNASITLGRLLRDQSVKERYHKKPVEEKKADYDRANKEVAILCNHQRSVPKGHAGSMEKLTQKLEDLKRDYKALEAQYKKAKAGEAKDAKTGKPIAPERVKAKMATMAERLKKLKLQKSVKEDLKTVALGTSKINYMDPRITVAWCKQHEVPIEKIFNKSLLSKFHWAMPVEPAFEF